MPSSRRRTRPRRIFRCGRSQKRSVASVGYVVATLAVSSGIPLHGQQEDTSAQCEHVVLEGRVEEGGLFEGALGPGLMFRLDPETGRQNPPGWTIRVTPAGDATTDYSMVVTPPHRFWNPRYVNTSYGVLAETALATTPRSFSFVVHESDYEFAKQALGVLLWPGNHTALEVAAADTAMQNVRKFDGTFWIRDGQASQPDSSNPQGAIEWLSFRAELCIPG